MPVNINLSLCANMERLSICASAYKINYKKSHTMILSQDSKKLGKFIGK